MAIISMIESGLVNLLSARLEALLTGRANQQKVIDILKQVITSQPNENISQFKNFFARAVQHADIESDYTISLDQLIQELDRNSALSNLLKMALYPPSDLAYQLKKIEQKIELFTKDNGISIPPELGKTAGDFVRKLYQLIRVFIELIEPDATLRTDIRHLKEQLAKPIIPLNALPISTIDNNFFKFKYDRQLVSFVPNIDLQQCLEKFLSSQSKTSEKPLPDIQIITLHGQGGVGKSRVAFELCLAQKDNGWNAGFLNQLQALDVTNYRWDSPSLIVFDYAAERLHELETLIEGLQVQFSQSLFHNPVRIVLLERQCSIKTGWFKQLLENSKLAPYLSLNGVNSAITLPSLTDGQLLNLATEYVSRGNDCKNQYLGQRVFEKAKEIEKAQPRPLILQIIAELFLEDEKTSYGSIEMLLEALFQREYTNVQKLSVESLVANQFWEVLAVATLTGGFEHQKLKTICQNALFSDWYKEKISEGVHNLVNHYLGKDSESSIYWFGLEPDLLGEYLILRHWRIWQKESAFSLTCSWHEKLESQLSLALALKGKTIDTLTRLCIDFNEKNPLMERNHFLELQKKWLKENHPQSDEYANFLVQYFVRSIVHGYMQNNAQTVWVNWEQLLNCYLLQPNFAIGKEVAKQSLAITDGHLLFSNKQMITVIDKVSDVAGEHNQLEILLNAASNMVNLTLNVSKSDSKTGRQFVDRLLLLSEKYNNLELWLKAAISLSNFIHVISNSNSILGQEYANKLLLLAKKLNHPEVWLKAAIGLKSLITGISEKESKSGQYYTDKLLELSDKQDRSEIWRQAAGALVNLINKTSKEHSIAGQLYTDRLLEISVRQNRPEFWLLSAQGMYNLIHRISEQDITAGQCYTDKLVTLAEQKNLPEIWLKTSAALMCTVTFLVGKDTRGAQQYTDSLLKLAEQQNHPKIWLNAAHGVVNFGGVINKQDIELGEQYAVRLLAMANKQSSLGICEAASLGIMQLIQCMVNQNDRPVQQYVDSLLLLAERQNLPQIWEFAAEGVCKFVAHEISKNNVTTAKTYFKTFRQIISNYELKGYYEVAEMMSHSLDT